MSPKTRQCHIHGSTIGAQDSCPECLAWLEDRPDPSVMTADERVAEMDYWNDILEVDFSLMHKRVEELVGRPVWTHEMASSVWPMLVDECRTRPGNVDPAAIMGKVQIIKPGMPTIAFVKD